MQYHLFPMLGYVGRLGNQLWQIATMIATAEQAGGEARFRPDWEYKPYFSIPERYFEILPVGAETHPHPAGYLQTYADWAPIRDRIFSYFQPSPLALEELKLYYGRELELAAHSIAVHVRRGDYRELADQFILLGGDYYGPAVERARQVVGPQPILLFSDEPQAASQIVPGPRHVVRPSGRAYRPDVCELFLMAMCHGHVIANSTYSWWGAFLADSPCVIYPDQWAYPSLELYYRWDKSIPEDTRWQACGIGDPVK